MEVFMRFRNSYILAAAAALVLIGSSAAFAMGGPGYAPRASSQYDSTISGSMASSDTTGVSGAMMQPTWSGYLVDKTSGIAMKSGDVDLTMAPQHLSREAEIANGGSGYGIGVLQGDTYKFFPFDDHGNQLASRLIQTSKRDSGLAIVVMGTMADGVVKVSRIVESNL
jgi:hypothetical protein